MKLDAISARERAYIIHCVNVPFGGKWSGKRMGARIDIVRFDQQGGGGIVRYSVTMGSHTHRSAHKTVAECIDEINRIVHGRRLRVVTLPQTNRSILQQSLLAGLVVFVLAELILWACNYRT